MTTPSDTGFLARQKSYDLLVAKVETGKSLSPSELTAMTRFEEELEKSGMNVPTVFVNPDQVAQYTGYAVTTIYSAVRKGKLIRLADNTFSRADVDKYLASKGRLPQVSTAPPSSGSDDDGIKKGTIQYEEKRYRIARADQKELIVARLRGQLVEKVEVGRQFTSRAHEFKTSLLLLSRRCSHKISAAGGMDSKLVADILDEEVRVLLKALCRKMVIHVD